MLLNWLFLKEHTEVETSFNVRALRSFSVAWSHLRGPELRVSQFSVVTVTHLTGLHNSR